MSKIIYKVAENVKRSKLTERQREVFDRLVQYNMRIFVVDTGKISGPDAYYGNEEPYYEQPIHWKVYQGLFRNNAIVLEERL